MPAVVVVCPSKQAGERRTSVWSVIAQERRAASACLLSIHLENGTRVCCCGSRVFTLFSAAATRNKHENSVTYPQCGKRSSDE